MTLACPLPDPAIGVVLRLSSYLGCQAEALGENGFEALAGGPIISGMLSATVTIFVALIGYRLILGATPSLRDGVGWAVRLGFVLALTSSWPAYQTLVYRTALSAPAEIASILLPAIGIPIEDLDQRIETNYEEIRQGSLTGTELQTGPAELGATEQKRIQSIGSFPAAPITATLLAISSVGITAAIKLVVGILVAVGPLIMLALLFDQTLGIVGGWISALIGGAIGSLTTTIIGAIQVVLIDSELARGGGLFATGSAPLALDTQSLTTIASVSFVASLLAIYASFRLGGSFRLRTLIQRSVLAGSTAATIRSQTSTNRSERTVEAEHARSGGTARTRATSVSDALAATVRREALHVGAPDTSASRRRLPELRGGRVEAHAGGPSAPNRSRTLPRRMGSAMRRDKPR